MADQTDLDPELLASLELFNEHLERSAEEEKAAKAVAKAERRKTEAANRARALSEDPEASAEAKAEAEAAYRDAVADLAARTDDPLGAGRGPDASEDTAEGDEDDPRSTEGGDRTADETAGAPAMGAEGDTGSGSSGGGDDAG